MTGRTVRLATPADAAELLRLREEMFAALASAGADGLAGQDVAPDAGPAGDWRQPFAAMVARRLRDEPDAFMAMVVDGDEPDRLVAGGIGWVEPHLPGPGNPSGRRGHIASMSTDPAFRRHGLGRAVFAEMMAWFETRGVTRIDLRATAMGEPLYRSFGFVPPQNAPLIWRPPR